MSETDRPTLRIYRPWGPHVDAPDPPPLEVHEADPPPPPPPCELVRAAVPWWAAACLAASALSLAAAVATLAFLIVRL